MPHVAEPVTAVEKTEHRPASSSFHAGSANLDLIRAFAVLCVFFGHLLPLAFHRDSLFEWRFAQMGVLIFFVHTSFVLMLSLERSPQTRWGVFGAFYLRRFFRLYPLSMFCVTIAFLLGVNPDIAAPFRHWTWGQYLSNMALTINLTYTDHMVGGLWTLPLEVQMYIVLPFLFLWAGRRPFKYLIALWVLCIPVAMLQPHVSGRLDVLGYAPCFVAGVIAWRLSRSAARRLTGWLWPAAFVATWPAFLIATHKNEMYYRWAFCLLLGFALPWFRELPFRPLTLIAKYVAKYSYGIYLTHIAVMLFCFGLPMPLQDKWLIFLCLAVICPIAVYHCVEQPMIEMGRKFSNRLTQRLRSG